MCLSLEWFMDFLFLAHTQTHTLAILLFHYFDSIHTHRHAQTSKKKQTAKAQGQSKHIFCYVHLYSIRVDFIFKFPVGLFMQIAFENEWPCIFSATHIPQQNCSVFIFTFWIRNGRLRLNKFGDCKVFQDKECSGFLF